MDKKHEPDEGEVQNRLKGLIDSLRKDSGEASGKGAAPAGAAGGGPPAPEAGREAGREAEASSFYKQRTAALEAELAREREKNVIHSEVESQIRDIHDKLRRETRQAQTDEEKSRAQGRVEALEKRLEEMNGTLVALVKEWMARGPQPAAAAPPRSAEDSAQAEARFQARTLAAFEKRSEELQQAFLARIDERLASDRKGLSDIAAQLRAPLQAEILAVLEKRLEETRQMLVSSARGELALIDRAATSALERGFHDILGALVSKETTEQIVRQAVDSLAAQLSTGFDRRLAESEAKLAPLSMEQLVRQAISPLAEKITDFVERRFGEAETLRREEHSHGLAAAMKPLREEISVVMNTLLSLEEKDARLRAADKEELRKRMLSAMQSPGKALDE